MRTGTILTLVALGWTLVAQQGPAMANDNPFRTAELSTSAAQATTNAAILSDESGASVTPVRYYRPYYGGYRGYYGYRPYYGYRAYRPYYGYGYRPYAAYRPYSTYYRGYGPYAYGYAPRYYGGYYPYRTGYRYW